MFWEFSCRLLRRELKKFYYRIKPSLCFISFSPVKREIFAGDFRDRVIHHLVYDTLNKHYEKILINDCYSCRKYRGTGYGIKRLAKFSRTVSQNKNFPAYVLKLDISGYFMNIDRGLLYKINKKLIKKFFAHEPQKINYLLYLLKIIINNNPTQNCRLRGDTGDWQGLPKNKSLFFAANGKGLPIGNLTSQLFGNIYLNDFDHFVKEKLKCKYYGRYVDDMVFIHQDKNFLLALIPKIKKYLKNNLGLDIHPKKIYLQPVRNGIPFLGVVIKPHRIYCGKRLIKNFYGKLKAAGFGRLKNPAFINSYLGYMKKYQTYNLRRHILDSEIGKKALKKLRVHPSSDYSKIEPDWALSPPKQH